MTKGRAELLIVDDDSANIHILIETLSVKYRLRVARTGAEALESVKKLPPDLILLDVMMPVMDGFEVCRCLKGDPTYKDIPIIFLTALNEDADEKRGLELGAADYLTKPFNSAIIEARVGNHLELKAHRDDLATLVAERTAALAKAYEQLSELDHLKDDFLRMISHEIRTPANGLLGIGELIIDLCPPSADLTLYRDLFNTSSLRLRNLIDDCAAIVNISNTFVQSEASTSLPTLFDDVQASLADIHILLDQAAVQPSLAIKGEHGLLKRALKTLILLATSFSRDKHVAHITAVVEARKLCIRLTLDDFNLSKEQAEDFFEMGSSVRGASAAEILGLSPVVAHKIISAFGGEMRLVKETGGSGYLEAVFITEPAPIVEVL